MRLIFPALCVCLLGQFLPAQTTSGAYTVSESDARQHLLQHEEALYPPIAKAVRVQGDVLIKVVISEKGQVKSEKVVTGPPMLQQAALDAVKKWKFKPFLMNDVPTPAATTLTIPFHIEQQGEGQAAEQHKAAQAWFPLSDKCRSALKAQSAPDALDFCKQALDMSYQAGDLNSGDQLARMDSHQLYGHALLVSGKPQEALEQENLAIQEAKKCLKDTNEEYAMPFFWRAMVEAHLGDVDAALSDFNVAEETHRKAILHLPQMKDTYNKILASILQQHAALLDLIGRPADAKKLRDEAAAL